ncbi:MAG TPA: serine/threonine-protein kinase [Gemmatimonadales bacterium]|nr:serine/threonine-protein kinase [Gemmatimonadales bacterium]
MARDLLPLIRQLLGDRYTIEREVGRGGAARVFLAHNAAGEAVALKVLHPQLTASVAAERFLREVQVISRLEHPRIARLLDFGEGDWVIYYVMEFVPGPTLKEHLARVRRASIPDVVRIADDVLSALAHAHKQGIVHRDVKPENIVLSPGGAVLLDFGIAKAVAASGNDRLTRSGFAVGTSTYMSPEQITGEEDIDHRSDLYSLGCVLFEALAGRPPFEDPFEEMVLRMHQSAPLPDLGALRPDAPPALVELIERALAKERDARWRSAEEMRAALPSLVTP